jgi:hypothetical protein
MEERQLVRILQQQEADASSYYDSELASAQEEALNRYFARPYGDEAPNRSRVVSHDVEDTINWIMPDLMRTFTSSEDLVSCKAQNPGDDQQYQGAPEDKSNCDVMAAYLSHIFFEDNDGATNIHDWLFDGLLTRIGVMCIDWEDPEASPPMMVEGVGAETLAKYLSDPEYEILGMETEEGPNGPSFVMEVRRTPKMGRAYIEVVPPEEFAIHKGAKSVCDAKYHRRKRAAYVSELVRKYPDKAEELKGKQWKISDPGDDERTQARHPDDNIIAADGSESDVGRRECWLIDEFVKIDFDDDGIVELRRVKRVDDIILENEAVTQSAYVEWTPNRVSHKAVGRSIHDLLKDLTKIKTVITRRYLDGLSQTITPRTYVNTQAIEQDGLDALVDNDIGGVIPTKGDPRAAVYESVTPDVSGPALNALAYFNEQMDLASGVTKQAQGMDPQAMNKTATGIDLLQAAAKVRVELIARWAGAGLEKVFKRLMHLVVSHQDGARTVKLFGKWLEVDPCTWSDEIGVRIDIGSAGVSKQQRIANLMMISQKQEAILLQSGVGNPIVSLQNYRNTLASLVSDMGFADPSQFFGQVPDDYQPPEPGPDPKVVEAQMKMQLEGQKAQQQSQLDAAKLQADQQLATAKFQSERELALIKAESEQQIAQIRIAAETEIARERTAAEMKLAVWKAKQEMKLARTTARAKVSNGKANGSDSVRMGGAIG